MAQVVLILFLATVGLCGCSPAVLSLKIDDLSSPRGEGCDAVFIYYNIKMKGQVDDTGNDYPKDTTKIMTNTKMTSDPVKLLLTPPAPSKVITPPKNRTNPVKLLLTPPAQSKVITPPKNRTHPVKLLLTPPSQSKVITPPKNRTHPVKLLLTPPAPSKVITPPKNTQQTTLPVATTEDPATLLRKYQVFPTECGIQQHTPNPTRRRRKRVVGGQSAQEGQFPWQVALLFKGQHYCGGSVVHRNWIVTGSHCFNPFTSHDPKDWIVKLGEHRLRNEEAFERAVRITNITIHEWYKSMWFEGITDTPPTYDIAILKLERPIVFNRHIQPICIMRPDTHFNWGQKCTVSGWGHLKWNGSQPNVLNYAEVPIVSHRDCNKEKSYNGTIHGTALCAGYPQGQVDSCEYDSGGPLACTKCGRYYLTGVVSWGHECALPHKYGVYARMEALTPWMVSIIGEEEAVTEAMNVRVG